MPTPLRVLILEDRPADAELVIHELQHSGFTTEWSRVETEKDFLQALNQDLDIILADYSLPQFDALQALHRLQASGLDVPFIIITGTVNEEVAVECMNQGASDYLLKDRLSRLGPAVVHALEQAELHRRKVQTEERLTLLSTALDAADNAVVITDRAGTIVWVNPAFTRATGYSYQQAVGHLSHLANSRAHDPSFYGNMWKTILAGHVWRSEILNRRKDGTTYMADITITPVRDEHGEITHFIDIEQDVTERKQREREQEAILIVANAMRSAKTRVEMLPVILDQIIETVKGEGAAIGLYDPANDEMVMTLGRGPFADTSGTRYPAGEGLTGYLAMIRQTYLTKNALDDPRIREHIVETPLALAGVPLIAQGQMVGLIWVGRKTEFSANEARLMNAIADIAANAIYRSTLNEETELRLQRLTALREVDKAITASLDIRVTLSVLVDQVVAQLAMHAADVLLFNAGTQTLEYSVSHGFRHNILPTSRLAGHCLAHRAVVERKIIAIPDYNQDPDRNGNRLLVRGEEFTAYFAVPLLAKGHVKGVLELFHRNAFYPNSDWLNFLETLAGQAAIAIDSAEMFNSLQRSNINLSLAYDDTIEGWSRALELRDQETQGHAQRVTERTVELARAAGIPENELIHVRRGALLHDIGKMGIPDDILLKQGPLTDAEWEIIRRHSGYAFELLAPVDFLRPALDIPYCHHERWDGCGYPRGLKGEEIPLAARVFSIVDVFDALTNDRPYRKRWDLELTLEYIREQAGTQFDPVLVDLFIDRMRGERE